LEEVLVPQDLWTTAVSRKVITSEQAHALVAMQKELEGDTGFRLSLTHLLWTGGTALILTALILLGDQVGEDSFFSLAWLLTTYAAGFALFARRLTRQKEIPRILWGCLGAAAVSLISAAIFFFQLAYLDANDLRWVNPIFDTLPPLDANDKPIVPGTWEIYIASGLGFGVTSAIFAILYLKRSSFLPIWIIIAFAIFSINYEGIRLLFPVFDQHDMQLEVSTLTFGAAMLALSLF
jgi:hypothetical protein